MIRSILRLTGPVLFFLISYVSLNAAAPIVTTVTVPFGNYKIGSVITFTIVADGTGYTVDAGTTINGVDVTSTFASAGGNNYTLTYTVASGNTDRASVGALPINILIRNGAGAGNLNTYTSSPVSAGVTIDANAPTISNVAIPNVAMKVGRVVTAAITVGDDGGETYTLSSGTIGGFTLGGFTKINNTTYEAQFTITNGGTDVAAGSNIPVNIILADPATNPSAANTTAIAQAGDAIDSNIPTIVNVTISNSSMKVGSVVTATIAVGNDGGQTYVISSGTIGGFTLGSLSRTNSTTYTAPFTVSNGGADVAAGSDIPVSLVIADPATNPSVTYTTAISQGADPIDANIPTISNVSIPDASMKVGDVVTATITVGDDGGQTYTLASSTIGGFTLGSFNRTNNTNYTAQFTITNGGTDVPAGSNIPVSVIVSDPATNQSSAFTTGISQVSDPIDANNPTVQTVGPLVTTGGNVVSAFWNSTNTGINITVPITNSDPSLNNGSIQLQANVNGGGFSNVGAASTITNGERVAGQKVFSLNDVGFEAISSTETNTVRFRAIVNDSVGNSSTFTQSALITIDQTAPAALVAVPDLTTATDTEGIAGTGTGTNTDNITKSTNPTFTGSGVNGTIVKIYSGATEIGSGLVSGSAYSIAVGAISESVHVITGRVMDAAGNLSTATTPYNVTIDRTPPQIGLKKWNADGAAGNKEEIIISFTEILDMSDGLLIANSDIDASKHGFSASISGIKDADSKFFSSITVNSTTYNNVIVLRSLNNGSWPNSSVVITYKDFATNSSAAIGNAPNYVFDLAGNELVTNSFTPSDTDPPTLASGFVLKPNDNTPETIVFQVNETLSQGASVTGFSVDGLPASGTYDLSATITLTSPANGVWNNTSVVSYAPGNVKDGTNNFLSSIPSTPIRLQNITMESNNANGFTNRAKPGNVVTVNFRSDITPSVTPSVIIDNDNATPAVVTGAHPNWQANYTITGSNNNGPLAMLVYMLTESDSTGTNSTTSPLPVSSSVVLDKNPPDITPISITSNNVNSSFATIGNLVTLSFSVNENLFTAPTVTIGGAGTVVTNIGLNYTATATLDNTFSEGVLPILINVQDEVGNLASATTTTNASSVTFDKTAPSVSSITLDNSIINSYAASINGTTPALNGNQVDFLVTFTEPVSGITTSSISRSISPLFGSFLFPTISSNVPVVSPVTSGGASSTAPSQYWKVLYPNVAGSGTLSINVLSDLNIIDIVQLSLAAGAAGPAYTVSLPQPSTPVTSFGSSTGTSSITINWTDIPGASHYLVIATTSASPSPAVTDGTYILDDFIIGDGTVSQNIVQGVQSATFSNLAATGYNVFIYPYSLSPNTTSINTSAINFNTTAPATISRNSDIIRDTGFSYSQNIDYKIFQTTDIPSGSGTGSLVLEKFLLRDGVDADNLGTTLSSITLDVVNYQNLRQLALYDGTTEIKELPVSGADITVMNSTTARMTFNSLAPFTAADGTSQPLSIRGSFLGTGVTDNQIISIGVVSVSASSTSSSQFITNSPTGIQSNLPSGTNNDNNKIEVTATKLDYTSIPLSATINVNFGPVVVQARDVNNIIDQDFVNAVSAFGNNDVVAMINTPFTPAPILSFTAGQLTLPPNFQFTATPGDGSTQLSISSGGINNQLSPSIGVVSSQESVLSYNSVAFVERLPYILFQSSDITGAGNSAALATFVLQDGNGLTLDLDGAPTKISSVTFDITTTNNLGVSVAGAKDVRKIALYNASGLELGEQALGNSTSVTFNIASAASYITADDNLSTTFTIRATFLNDNANVRDLNNIRIKLTNVTQGSGSELNTLLPSLTGGSWTKATGAITNGQLTPIDKNIVDVVATKLQFIQQPSSVVGINRPVPLPPGTPVKIVANDTNGLIDLEFNNAYNSKLTLTVPTTTPTAQLQTTSFAYSDGEVTLDPNTLVYTSAGDGTLTATSTNNPPTALTVTAAVSNLVDVFDVTAIYSFAGVNTPSNFAGGSVNKIIYGVTFTAPFTRSSEPKLNSFVISFDNTITGVFKNPRVFEQKNNSTYSSIIAKNITDAAIKGKVTQGSFTFTVDFTGVGGVPRDFHAIGGTTYTYFLMVDVETTANSGTPPMQPYIEDLDWQFGTPGSLDPTSGNIVTSLGSTHASKTNTSGLTFSFAAIYPPSLIVSNPSKGQINVDPNGNIELTFDAPIWSLDATIELFQTTSVGTPGTKVGDLQLLGNQGRFDSSKPQTDAVNIGHLSPTITFDVPSPLAFNQIYYVNIKKGTFDQTSNAGAGIIDQSGNKFPGIFSPGVLYFRTSSNIAPKLLSTGTSPTTPLPSQIINISLTGATIQASFDFPGNAYFMLTNNPTITPPTNDQIKGDVAYAGSLTRGNFTISQTNPITQFGTINYGLSTNQQYDVWMFAENSDLPSAIRTVGPYQGSPGFAASATPASPTFTFTATTPVGTGVILYSPTYSICPGSYQPLNEPITIVERNNGDFTGTGSGIQTFNLLLPPGFEFETSLPVNGKVILSSTADFIANSGSLSFLSNSVVQVIYTNANTPTNSRDNISISGLKVLATGAASGSITRLGGTTLTAVNAIPDGAVVANIGTNSIDPISFTNSYLGDGSILPDLINDKFETVQLIPTVPAGDYGASTFSGQGVTLDSLYLSSVTLGLSFNITISHTDNNGCVSQNAIQYLVYDHRTGLGLAPSYCITNYYFPTPGTYPTTYSVFFNSFPGFYLTSLSTGVPITITPGSQYLDNSWSSIIQTLPVKSITGFNPNDNPLPGTSYYNYTFDVRTINNNTDWYDFREFNSTTGQGKPYYQGGSLGRVEYTGLYQSIANVALTDVKLVQSTQLFAPAIAYLEVSGNISNGGAPLTNDPSNPFVASDFDPKNGPQPSGYLPNLGNPGTFIFCEQGGPITINGYPAASGGTSVGKFTLVNHATGTPLVLTPDPASPGNFLGFKDNGNGVATINPTLVNNSYNNIRIVYEYQDNNSPCKSLATLVLRITPNPVASFRTSTLCEDVQINFSDQSSYATASGVILDKWTWNFSDINASATGTNSNSATSQNPIHTYSDPLDYSNVTLNVTTNFGCSNLVPATKTLSVGGTPKVAFGFSGISAADDIEFVSSSTVANDAIARLDWTFGDGTIKPIASNFNSPELKKYTNEGTYKVNLKVTSAKGCDANLNKTIIILRRSTPTMADAYLAPFESDNGGWQHAATSKPGFNTNDSWKHGVVSKTITQMEDTLNGKKVWATSLTGNFNPEERSALYSPSFDLRNLSRPMVSFNSFVQFNSSEGIILQYSVDNKNVADSSKVWLVLGEQIGEGVDWFNEQGIAAKPGDQLSKDFGWSGIDKIKWIRPKHTLSDIPVPSRAQVVFRFALATLNKNPDQEGFALDHFRIGERTRVVLVENFTNKGTSNAYEKTESDYLKTDFPGIVGTDYIKINYHVGFPGTDPFNTTNPADPSARALYYHVSKTPTAFLDSFDDPIPLNNVSRLFSKWGETVYGSQSLELAGADIKITATLLPSNTYSVSVSVTAKKDLPVSTILHTGFLEAKIISTSPLILTGETEFEYVLKRLLPSAAGTRFGAPLLKDQTKTFGPFEWTADPAKLFPAKDDLAVVAFLQDETTQEVHQSELKKGLTDPVVVTGIEEILPEQVNVYPNPVSGEFKVELPSIVQNEAKIHLIDLTGRRYQKEMIPSGSNSAAVNVEDLAEGIYIIEIGAGSTGIIRKKIMVVMKN